MGKTNKAQRTKGNTRPSSSDHSAQLLSLNGKTINGFIGFDGLEKEIACYAPVTGQLDLECVDSDFRMVMRKMLKRDETTRLKGLQEFKEYCSQKNVEAVKNVVPYWPRIFNKLAMDNDRRVREATHLANNELISKVKRDIAPYLKSIMGQWLLGQCDLYAPSASAAQAAFASTFPTAKQSDALMHCKQEIIAYYTDNILEQTLSSLYDPFPYAINVRESRYNLVMSCTLSAFKLFLNIVHPSEYKNLKDDFCSLVAHKRFWTYSTINLPQVLGSWYSFIGSLCQAMPYVFEGMENKLATTIFSHLSESNPIVAPAVWEAALSIILHFQNCWENINMNKVVLPQLWSLLKKGGKGNAQALFPCLLPFLSKLPREVVQDERFVLQFFSNMKEGLFVENIKESHVECDAVLTAFMECLHYICFARITDLNIGFRLFETVLLNEVVPIIDRSFYSRNTHLPASKLYPLIGEMLQKFEYKCQAENDVSAYYSEVLLIFWDHLYPVLSKCFILSKAVKVDSVMYLSYFFNSILVPFEAQVKLEKSKVRFEDEKEAPDSENKTDFSTKKTLDPYSIMLSSKKSKSFSYIAEFSKHLCKTLIEEFDFYFINLLVEILESAPDEDLLVEVMTISIEKRTGDELSLNFCYEYVFKIIAQTRDVSKLNGMADLIFVLCCGISEREALKILAYCSMIKSPGLIQCLLSKGLLKYSDKSFFQEWVKIPSFYDHIFKDFNETLYQIILPLNNIAIQKSDFKPYLGIINMCLKSYLIEKSFLNSGSLEKMLLSLKDFAEKLFVSNYSSASLQQYVELLSDLVNCILVNSTVCWNFRATEDVISVIFCQSLESYHSAHTLRNIWMTAIESYIKVKSEIVHDNSLILSLASSLHKSILNLKTLEQAKHVLDHCHHLLSVVQESLNLKKSKLQYSALFALYKLMDSILLTNKDWNQLKEGFNFSSIPLFLKKKLFYPLFVEESFFPSGNIQEIFLTVYVTSKVIIKELSRTSSLTDEKFSESYVTKHFPHILWFGTFFEETSAVNVLPKELSAIKVSEDCFEMLKFLPNGITNIISEIIETSLICSTYWTIPLQFFIQHYDHLQPQSIPTMVEDLMWKYTLSENLNKYAFQQIIIPYLSKEKQMIQLEMRLQELSLLRDLIDENYAGKLGEVCCYLQNKDLDLTSEMQNMLSEILCYVIEYDFANENLKFAYSLQITSIFESIVKHGFQNISPLIMNYFVANLKLYTSQNEYSMDFQIPKVCLEMNQAFSIFNALSTYFCFDQDQAMCKNNEKQAIFDDTIHPNMISLYLHVANVFNEFKPLPEICSTILLNVSDAMRFLSSESLFKIIDSNTQIPQMKTDVLQSLVSTLTFGIQLIQFTSHSMLMKIMRILPQIMLISEKSQNDEDTEDDIEKLPQSLSSVIELLNFLTEIVDSMLSDFKIGDLCCVAPQTDAYVYTMAYLLTWIEMLEFISSSPSQVRSLYATDLEETKLLSHLFTNVFQLIPSNPLSCLQKEINTGTPKKEELKLLFSHPPVLNSYASCLEDIQIVACYVYATVLRKVPASIRTWWNNLDAKAADIVNKFTTKYISGLLCIEEIQAVHESEKHFENMMIQARPSSREVIATYTIDDSAIELSVQLPINYPLGPISAERRGKGVIGQLEWRHWLMQLTTVLRYQNGSILDGLIIWKRNLDKKFEGVEECMICFYVLHNPSMKLPKVTCRVCKKKFHSACLYKWFDKSYNSTCPLCRNEFFTPPASQKN